MKLVLPKKHKYIVSFLHGKPDDSPEVKKHIEDFLKTKNSIFKIVTASSLVYQRLLNWGIEEQKISLIPIGVDTEEDYLAIKKIMEYKSK